MKAAQVLLLVVLLAGFSLLSQAQNSKKAFPVPAPIPSQIAAAQKVFISNGGGVSIAELTDETLLSGSPDRAYDEFYTEINSWGRYDLVPSGRSGTGSRGFLGIDFS